MQVKSQRHNVQFACRKVIEALRLGIVPDSEVRHFTFGRDREIKQLTDWLNERNHNDGVRFIVGSYGSGKTHLLNCLRAHAIRQGYAVASIEIDSQETTFAKPKRVYRQVTQSFRAKLPQSNKIIRFRDFLRYTLSRNLLRDHPYFRFVSDNEAVWQWIEGHDDAVYPDNDPRNKPPKLYPYSNAANIYCNLLSSLGWASQQIGLKGLLLTFDESESLFSRTSYYAAKHSYNFLEALVQVANNDQQMLLPLEEARFEHAKKAQHIHFQYKSPSNLKLVFAFTDVSDLYHSPILGNIKKINLTFLEHTNFDQIFERIFYIYQKAYPYRFQSKIYDNFRSLIRQKLTERVHLTRVPRMKIKGFIELLDSIANNP